MEIKKAHNYKALKATLLGLAMTLIAIAAPVIQGSAANQNWEMLGFGVVILLIGFGCVGFRQWLEYVEPDPEEESKAAKDDEDLKPLDTKTPAEVEKEEKKSEEKPKDAPADPPKAP